MQRISISSTPSCSNAGPDDLESLGDVYIWGELWSEGAPTDISVTQSSSKVDILVPKPLETDIVLDVHQISCGARHISLVTRQGEVFTWGEESGGRLGHGFDVDLNQPRLVEFLSLTNVDFVACGEYHTCAISTHGDLFTWGDGTHNAGLLGQGTDVSHWVPKRVSGPVDGLQVQMIACGVWHSAMITSSGRLFTFGDGKFGVLGHGDRESVLYPKEVQQLSMFKSIKVACGVYHTAAIVEVSTSSGPIPNMSAKKLFTWGDGDKYRLGHQNKETYLFPTCVSALIDYNFHQIACGHTMTVALTTSGHVFTMGGTSYGQLGNPSAEGKEPSLVKDRLVGEFVEEIACGANHVAVLTSRSEVFTWGKGANGRLGHGDIEDRKSPTLVEALKDRLVKSIACGSNFTSSICIHKWVSGADQSVCSGCRQAFGFTRKRHNCYNCGLVHCHGCSSKKALKAALAPTPNKPHRVCDACYNKLKSTTVGSGSTYSKKVTNARRSVDLTREKFDNYETRSSRILPTQPMEPVKYPEVKSQKSGAGSESVSIIRASQVPTFQPMKDATFPSSLSTLQSNVRPTSLIPPAPMLPNNATSSRLSSAYTRRAGPSGSAPLSSRAAMDNLKKSNEALSEEVARLLNQNNALREKFKSRTEENENLLQHAREATTRCKVAEEVIKLVITQLNEMAESLPPDKYESNGFRAMRMQADSFLEGRETEISDPQLSLLEEADYTNQHDIHSRVSTDIQDSISDEIQDSISDEIQDTVSDENSDNPGFRQQDSEPVSNETTEPPPPTTTEDDENHVDYSESSGARDVPNNSETSVNEDIREPTKPSNNTPRVKATEVIEQFEPGVYVTVVQLRNGLKFFRRVRFSRKRYSEKQAEEWWKSNKEHVFKKYPPPQPAPSMKYSGPLPPPPPPNEESNEADTST